MANYREVFPRLAGLVDAHYDGKAAEMREALPAMTAGQALESWYYRGMMTPAALALVQACGTDDPIPQAAQEKMLRRFCRKNEAARADMLAKLQAAADAPALELLTVSVEWARSRTWGSNPTATAQAYGGHTMRETRGHASGCGYDKESAAIASALNTSPAVMRVLYDHAEKGGEFAYSVQTFAGVPSFDGGCGVSCFRSVFEGCGYAWQDVAHGRSFDAYKLAPMAEEAGV